MAFQINADAQAYFTGRVNALAGAEVKGDFYAVNNAYITTRQDNANSYLNGDVYLSRGGDPYGHSIGPSKAHAIVLRGDAVGVGQIGYCLLYTSPSPRDLSTSRMPSSA